MAENQSLEVFNIISITLSSLAILINIVFFIAIITIPNKPTKSEFRFLSIQFIICSLLLCVYSIISSATHFTMCNVVLFLRNVTICPITSTCLCIVLITYSTLQSKQKIEDNKFKFRLVFILLTWVFPTIVVTVSQLLQLNDDSSMDESYETEGFCLTKSMVHKVVMGCLVGLYELFTIVISIIIIIKLHELSKFFVEKELTKKVIWKICLYIIGILVFLGIALIESPLPYFRDLLPDGTFIVGRIMLAIANPVLLGLFVWNRQVQKRLTRMLLCQKSNNYDDSLIRSTETESNNSEGMRVELDIEFGKQGNNDSSTE